MRAPVSRSPLDVRFVIVRRSVSGSRGLGARLAAEATIAAGEHEQVPTVLAPGQGGKGGESCQAAEEAAVAIEQVVKRGHATILEGRRHARSRRTHGASRLLQTGRGSSEFGLSEPSALVERGSRASRVMCRSGWRRHGDNHPAHEADVLLVDRWEGLGWFGGRESFRFHVLASCATRAASGWSDRTMSRMALTMRRSQRALRRRRRSRCASRPRLPPAVITSSAASPECEGWRFAMSVSFVQVAEMCSSACRQASTAPTADPSGGSCSQSGPPGSAATSEERCHRSVRPGLRVSPRVARCRRRRCSEPRLGVGGDLGAEPTPGPVPTGHETGSGAVGECQDVAALAVIAEGALETPSVLLAR